MEKMYSGGLIGFVPCYSSRKQTRIVRSKSYQRGKEKVLEKLEKKNDNKN